MIYCQTRGLGTPGMIDSRGWHYGPNGEIVDDVTGAVLSTSSAVPIATSSGDVMAQQRAEAVRRSAMIWGGAALAGGLAYLLLRRR